MAATSVSVPGEVAPATTCLCEMCTELFKLVSFTKGLYTFLSGEFVLVCGMGESVLGLFKSRLFFLLCIITFLGVFPVVFNHQQSHIV